MMKRSKLLAPFMASLVLMSSTAFASGASYSVHDDEVRSTLKDVRTDVNNIKELLEIIKQKELNMDLLDKAAADRTNDSMQKLSLDDSMGFVFNNTNQIDFGDLLKPGSGGFLEKFTEDLAKDGINLKLFAQNSPIISLEIGDFVLKFDGILNGANFDGLTDPTSIKTVYMQNMMALSDEEAKIDAELAAFNEEKKKLDDKDEQRLQDITKAKDSKNQNKLSLESVIAGAGGILSGDKTGGSTFDPTSARTIFMKDGTESVTGAQERTTSVEAVRTAKEMRESEAEAFRRQAQIKKNEIARIKLANDFYLSVYLGNAESAAIRALPVNPKGSKYESGFKKYKY